jgi:hypothetical protein
MRKLVLLCFAIIALGLSAQTPEAEEGTVYLRAIANKQTIQFDDVLLLKLEVTNIGRDPLYFFSDDLCFNPGAGLSLEVRDSGNKILKPSVPLNCPPAEPDVTDAQRFQRITPDSFFGRFAQLQVSRIVPKPGDYQLTFTLRSTVTPQRASQLPKSGKPRAFLSTDPPLKSTIDIKVTQ